MNESEKIAYEYLIKKKKYKSNQIGFQKHKSPDFICNDGKGFEAKRLSGNLVIFSELQRDTMEKENTTIIITDENEVIQEISYRELKDSKFPIIKVIEMKDMTVIKISRQTRDRMKLFGLKGDTYDDVINKICDIAESQKMA